MEGGMSIRGMCVYVGEGGDGGACLGRGCGKVRGFGRWDEQEAGRE